jgi:ribosomal protein L35
LAWFGGTGYLLVRFSSLWVFFSLGIAGAAGFAGAGTVFLLLAKVLMRKEENLNPADYDMVGVLGHLSIRIRKGGTGEIVFAQAGTRHCTAARSEDGVEIPKDTEVVVTRYEKGIAYVQRWDDLAGTAAGEN